MNEFEQLFGKYNKRVYGEDGIIDYIFSIINPKYNVFLR